MISIDEALRMVLAEARPLPPREVGLEEAAGCLLAADILADRDAPPFDKAMMDGFAVRVADAGRQVPVAGEVAAGDLPSGPLDAGRAVRIMTGAPCPPGTEAVVPVEETVESEGLVALPTRVRPGQHLARRGSDGRAGETVLRAGQRITPLGLAVLATVGAARVPVVPRPAAAIVSTGDELVDATSAPLPQQIRDGNLPMLLALARGAGLEIRSAGRAGDRLEELEAAIARGLECDLVLIAGGVSAGKYDLVPEAARRLGVRTVFHRVAQKPGKPLFFGVREGARRSLFFGLPGNPLSVHFCFHRYVLPAARGLAGLPPLERSDRAVLAASQRADEVRHLFHPARVRLLDGGRRVARPLACSGSADTFGAAAANALLSLPPGAGELPAGSEVAFFWLEPEEEAVAGA